jgi:hypothetical protein
MSPEKPLDNRLSARASICWHLGPLMSYSAPI